MVAARDLERAPRLREDALLDVLDPGAGHAQRHLVLGLAGHRAGVTADAAPVVDQEGVVQRRDSTSGKRETPHPFRSPLPGEGQGEGDTGRERSGR